MQKLKRHTVQFGLVGLLALSVAGAVGTLAPQPAYALDCAILPKSICDNADTQDPNKGGILLILKWVLTIMTGLVGVAAVGGVIWAGVLYTSAGEKADQVKKAKEVIINVVIGLVAYGVMFIALNWIIPGGIFG